MAKTADTIRVSVDLPINTHQEFFNLCKFKLGNVSMNKRIIQLVQADLKAAAPQKPKRS